MRLCTSIRSSSDFQPAISSSQIFAALFELELAGRVKQLPGKKFVKSFYFSVGSSQFSVFTHR